MRRAVFTKDAMERAARSGALCMVVRSEEWKPVTGITADDVRLVERDPGKPFCSTSDTLTRLSRLIYECTSGPIAEPKASSMFGRGTAYQKASTGELEDGDTIPLTRFAYILVYSMGGRFY
jgi:hypothetical protein